MENGRAKIKNYLKSVGKTYADLATAYGVSRDYMTKVINNQERTPRANELVLQIIADFKIR